jgi:phosphoribosyl-ATP pyrophosphohydrolase/phosphoribosyl-AMP cyclohydrolase
MEKQYNCDPILILKEGKAFTSQGTQVEDVTAYLAQKAAEGASMGFFLDASEKDEDHEAAIGLIRQYTKAGILPVMAGGRTRRLEDVKKYLYAGARAALIRQEDETEMAVYEEAIRRFGKNRLALYHGVGSSAQADSATGDSLPGFPVSGTVTVQEPETDLSWSQFKLGPDGLLPCIVQDVHTGQVLMMAYMNEEAFLRTCQTGRMNYFSRSRQSQWLKGETSGHFQYVRSLTADCDWDTLLAKVEQVGVACHTGSYSCFFRPLLEEGGSERSTGNVFEELEQVIAHRKAHPKEGSYTNYLFDKGIDKILKKVGEEATEIVIAAKNPNPEEVKYEAADFLYHLMVLLAEKGVTWKDVTDELAKR